jgi:2-dehydropantoate 2-reductase
MKEPIHILGPGALGCLWAAKLSPFMPVSLIGRDAVAVTRQFTLITPEQTTCVSLPLFGTSDGSGTNRQEPLRFVLVFTKSYAARSALEGLKPYMDRRTRIVLFQNGLGSQMDVLNAFAENPVFAAVTTEGANKLDSTTVVHAGIGSTTIGALNPAAAQRDILSECVWRLGSSDLCVSKSDDIWESLWQKLAINCAINPFTAIFDCPNGQVPGQAYFAEVWPALLEELGIMLKQAGYAMASQALEQRIFSVMEKTRHNISSMLQDIRNRRPTENDDISGFACRYLATHGLPHAVNLALWEKVKALGQLPAQQSPQ